MPHNKSQKINNQQNDASLLEKKMTSKAAKLAGRPPSLNGIGKQQP